VQVRQCRSTETGEGELLRRFHFSYCAIAGYTEPKTIERILLFRFFPSYSVLSELYSYKAYFCHSFTTIHIISFQHRPIPQ